MFSSWIIGNFWILRLRQFLFGVDSDRDIVVISKFIWWDERRYQKYIFSCCWSKIKKKKNWSTFLISWNRDAKATIEKGKVLVCTWNGWGPAAGHWTKNKWRGAEFCPTNKKMRSRFSRLFNGEFPVSPSVELFLKSRYVVSTWQPF